MSQADVIRIDARAEYSEPRRFISTSLYGFQRTGAPAAKHRRTILIECLHQHCLRSSDKTRITNSRAVLQRVVNRAAGVNLGPTTSALILRWLGHSVLQSGSFRYRNRTCGQQSDSIRWRYLSQCGQDIFCRSMCRPSRPGYTTAFVLRSPKRGEYEDI